MNKKIVIILALIFLGALGYIFMNQPVANAPENKLSAASVAPTTPEALALVGKWQSADDEKFTRELRADGTVTDMYEGAADATTAGNWYQITDVSQEPVEIPAVGDATFIKIQFEGVPLYFTVNSATETDLELTYLDRGGVMKFKRIP